MRNVTVNVDLQGLSRPVILFQPTGTICCWDIHVHTKVWIRQYRPIFSSWVSSCADVNWIMSMALLLYYCVYVRSSCFCTLHYSSARWYKTCKSIECMSCWIRTTYVGCIELCGWPPDHGDTVNRQPLHAVCSLTLWTYSNTDVALWQEQCAGQKLWPGTEERWGSDCCCNCCRCDWN